MFEKIPTNLPDPEKIPATQETKDAILRSTQEMLAKRAQRYKQIEKLDYDPSTGGMFELEDGRSGHLLLAADFGEDNADLYKADEERIELIVTTPTANPKKLDEKKFLLTWGGDLKVFNRTIDIEEEELEESYADILPPEQAAERWTAEDDAQENRERAAEEMGLSATTEAEALYALDVINKVRALGVLE